MPIEETDGAASGSGSASAVSGATKLAPFAASGTGAATGYGDDLSMGVGEAGSEATGEAESGSIAGAFGFAVASSHAQDSWCPLEYNLDEAQAIDLHQDPDERGCCRTSIRATGSLTYGGFQDFAANLFPQYLRFRTTNVFNDVTPTYPIGGSMATVPGVEETNTQRYRAPQCMWTADPFDDFTLKRGIFGREETVYTPDNKEILFFRNAVILTDSPRIEVDPGPGAPGPRTLHYWTVSGTPVQVDDQTEETPILWRYEIQSDHPEDDGSADCGVDGCDGGTAGLSTRKYEIPYTAELFAEYLNWLVRENDLGELWRQCEWPNTEIGSLYPQGGDCGNPNCDGSAGTGCDNAYDDMFSWPGAPDTDYTFPGENQPDDNDKFPPPYDCGVNYDVGSYYAPMPNAVPDGFVGDAHVTPIIGSSQSIFDGAVLNYPAALSIVATASRFEVSYSIVQRWWSAPFRRTVTEIDVDGVNPPVETVIDTEEDLDGERTRYAPCRREDDPILTDALEDILEDKFTTLTQDQSWSRVITWECP